MLAAVPSSVTVPFANTTASFSVATRAVGVSTPVTLTANRLGVNRQTTLTLQPSGSTVVPNFLNVNPGILVSGGLPELYNPDNQRLHARLDLSQDEVGFPVTVTLGGTASVSAPTSLSFTLEGYVQFTGFQQTVQLFDWAAGQFVTVDGRSAPTTQVSITVAPSGSLARFVQTGTRSMRARIGYEPIVAELASAWNIWIDRAWWNVE